MDVVITAAYSLRFVNIQKIKYNWTNCSIYDFFVEESVLYEIQQSCVCTFSDLTQRERERKMKNNREISHLFDE